MSLFDVFPTRRGLIAQSGVLATLAATPVSAKPSPVEEGLLVLGAKLDACHAARGIFQSLNEFGEDPYYEQHWKLREKINALPARNMEEARVKARAAAYALEDDKQAENEGLGAFINLSRSLISDLLDPHFLLGGRR